MATETQKVRIPGLTVLVVLALLSTIYLARDFLLPITFALLLAFFFSPVIRALARAHIPPPAGAALIVLSLVAVVGFGGYELAGPVKDMVVHAPETVRKAGVRLRVLEKPVNQVTEAANQIEQATDVDAGTRVRQVVVEGPSLASRLFGTSQAFAEGAIEVILLFYFLLATGDLFIDKLAKVLPPARGVNSAATITRQIEASISTYLFTTAAINVGEGIVVSLAMWLLGMPTPFLWGTIAACLEFIPYIGMTINTAILTVAGLTTFSSLPHALAVPGTFVLINLLQGNLVTPLVMSRRLTMNPVALFVGLAFWWWVWGIAGALLAVPLLAAFKILCDHVASLSAVGEFLGGRDSGLKREMEPSRQTRAELAPNPALQQPGP